MIGKIKSAASALLQPKPPPAAKVSPRTHAQDVFVGAGHDRLEPAQLQGTQEQIVVDRDPVLGFPEESAPAPQATLPEDLHHDLPDELEVIEGDEGTFPKRGTGAGGSNPASGRQDPGRRSGRSIF